MRIRRSLAWAYGNDTERCKRHIASVCDGITIDLEDAVMPSVKPFARKNTVMMLKEFDFRGKERIVRINNPHTEYYKADMEEVISITPPDCIRLPKCETAEDVLIVDRDLAEIENKFGLPKNSIEIIAMIESPLGIRNAYEVASSCKRVTAISIGMEDLTAEMGIERRYEEGVTDLLYARQKLVLDGKAAGVQVLDSGFNKIAGDDFNEIYNRESVRMGFDGRSVRDNDQAVIANRMYAPSEKEVDWAYRAKTTYEESNRTGDCFAYVDGRHLCAAAYEKAKRIVAKAELIKEKEKLFSESN